MLLSLIKQGIVIGTGFVIFFSSDENKNCCISYRGKVFKEFTKFIKYYGKVYDEEHPDEL